MGTVPIAENGEAVVDLRANEVCIRTKTTFVDPARCRGGAGAQSPIKMCFTGETQTASGSWEDIGSVKFAQDERYRSDPFNLTSEVEILVRHQQAGVSDDKQFIRVARFRHDGIEFFVPVIGAIAAEPSAFTSDDRRYLYNVQGDPTPEYPHGRIVQYERATMTPVAILRPERL